MRTKILVRCPTFFQEATRDVDDIIGDGNDRRGAITGAKTVILRFQSAHILPFHAAAHSFLRLCAMHTMRHSLRMLSMPFSKNCLKPRPRLIWPNTGSVIHLR